MRRPYVGAPTGLALLAAAVACGGPEPRPAAPLGVEEEPAVAGPTVPAHPPGMIRVTQRFFNESGEDGWGTNSGGRNLYVADATAPIDAPTVLEMPFGPCASCGGSAMGNQIVKNFTASGQELYLTFTLKYSENWVGNPSEVNKLMYPATTGSMNTPVYLAAIGLDREPLEFQVRLQGQDSGVCPHGNTSRNLRPNRSEGELHRGRWHTVEVYLKLNTPSFGPTCDGALQVWIDGALTHEYTDVHFLDASFPAARWEWGRLNFAPVWGGGEGEIPERQYLRTAHVLAAVK